MHGIDDEGLAALRAAADERTEQAAAALAAAEVDSTELMLIGEVVRIDQDADEDVRDAIGFEYVDWAEEVEEGEPYDIALTNIVGKDGQLTVLDDSGSFLLPAGFPWQELTLQPGVEYSPLSIEKIRGLAAKHATGLPRAMCIRVDRIQALIDDPRAGIVSLVGDHGGTSLITGSLDPSSVVMGALAVETEHGTLYLDLDGEVVVREDADLFNPFSEKG